MALAAAFALATAPHGVSQLAQERAGSVASLQASQGAVDTAEAATLDEAAPASERGSSLFATVKQGGPLMILIVLLGIISLTIVIERLIYYTKRDVWKTETIEIELRESAAKSRARFREDLEDEIRALFGIYAGGMERGLALLSGIGNIAPVIGFLGTVIGMISAFASIAAATTVNAKVVAVGIQVALVTTAGGLVVAAPTLMFFYFFTHLIQNRYALAEQIINDLCDGLPRLSERLCEDQSDAAIPGQGRSRSRAGRKSAE
jgi:biopolymer transport protein ExbB